MLVVFVFVCQQPLGDHFAGHYSYLLQSMRDLPELVTHP
jgi:hypothetical protein